MGEQTIAIELEKSELEIVTSVMGNFLDLAVKGYEADPSKFKKEEVVVMNRTITLYNQLIDILENI